MPGEFKIPHPCYVNDDTEGYFHIPDYCRLLSVFKCKLGGGCAGDAGGRGGHGEVEGRVDLALAPILELA